MGQARVLNLGQQGRNICRGPVRGSGSGSGGGSSRCHYQGSREWVRSLESHLKGG